MSPAPTYSLPELGSDNSTEDPKIRTALSDLKTLLTGGLDDDNLDDAVVTDTKLASPNNSVYKTIALGGGVIKADASAATYALVPLASFTAASYVENGLLQPSTQDLTAATTTANFGTGFSAFTYFDDADYTVGSLTQKLRVRAQVSTNATAWSSVTATFGLYPVTFAGGANTLTATLGTVVSGSTTAIANPSASTTNQGNSGDFTIPSDGQFCLGVVLSATLTNNAAALLTAQLQTRNV